MRKPNYLIGIFLISLATLLLELSLTRVMSVSLWYHFGFLVISTALLGFGMAGVVLASWKQLREKFFLGKTLSILCLLFGLVTVVSFWLLQKIPFNPFAVATDKRQLYIMPLYYLTVTAPFFLSGLVISLLFTRISKNMARLYAFDLAGAALGCLLIVLTMPKLGGSGSVVMAAALGTLAAVPFSEKQPLKLIAALLAIAICAFSFFSSTYLPVNISEGKFPKRWRTFTPIYSAWNTFSMIDLYEIKPDSATGLGGSRRFIIDGGTAATGMDNLRDGVDKHTAGADSNYLSAISYLHIQNPSVLDIGSGGGQEVLDALHNKAREVTCIEINPIITHLVKNEMNEYWGGLFNRPDVHLVTEEGRSFINRSHEQYDAIVSAHTISNAAVASGALSLSENFVLTKEAFQEYYDHLTPNGVIYFTRPESQLPRLFTTGREMLAENGLTDFAKHFYAFRFPPDAGLQGKSFVGGFIVKKSAFTEKEINNIDSLILNMHSEIDGAWKPLEKLYSPFREIKNVYGEILTTGNLNGFYKRQTSQLKPATDDKPFFNQHVRWSSVRWQTIRDVFSQDNPMAARMALENKPIAEVTLLLILAQSIILAVILILIPLFRYSKQGLQFRNKWRWLGYFACLGLGFIMIEISFIQRFTLYLGQPVYTLAVIIAGLLLFTGIGSYASGMRNVDRNGLVKKFLPALLVVLLLTSFITPIVFKSTIQWTLAVRVVLTLLLLAPMGILLGIPFPTGIKTVSIESEAFIPWAWGVNGFFTVIGSVGAVILGMMLGFKIVILLATVFYAMAIFLIPKKD